MDEDHVGESSFDELGPVDWIVVEFPRQPPSAPSRWWPTASDAAPTDATTDATTAEIDGTDSGSGPAQS